MGTMTLVICGAGLVLGIFRLGVGLHRPLLRALVRPAVAAGLGALLMLMAGGEPHRWPYSLVAATAVLGVWEAYAGVYGTLRAAGVRGSPVRQVQVCAIWLSAVLTNLTLLNMAVQSLFPATFAWRGAPASMLDVAYLTLLTFASGGYGDVVPMTVAGKLLSMLTSLAGLLYATILFTALFQTLRED